VATLDNRIDELVVEVESQKSVKSATGDMPVCSIQQEEDMRKELLQMRDNWNSWKKICL
jgi:hypothetical protein